MSPGLAAAVSAAQAFGNVWVAAPSSQKTGAGRSLIGERTKPFQSVELTVDGRRVNAWHLEATPALVVRHALFTTLRNVKIDLAISGINYGENIGYDIGNSGTVGAAAECAALGVPGIAVSVQTDVAAHRAYGEVDWGPTQFFLAKFIRMFMDKGGFRGFDVLKLDVPAGADRKTEWKTCRVQRSPYYLTRMSRHSPEAVVADGSLYVDARRYQPGTDAYTLLTEKKVAVAPLTLDWSAPEAAGFFS